MTRLKDISVRVEPGAGIAPITAGMVAAGGLGGGVAAILAELVTLLERLADSGTAAAIDLRSLPMSPQDRVELERALGDGEVQATVTAHGVSAIRETGIAGIWWAEHRDPQGAPIAEFLEVTRVPQILAAAPDDIAAAAAALRAQITAIAATRPS
ncbi:MAG: hydrogenase expression/formation C-terminal domain-containing protein [Steroidobacteraceae bacterium]